MNAIKEASRIVRMIKGESVEDSLVAPEDRRGEEEAETDDEYWEEDEVPVDNGRSHKWFSKPCNPKLVRVTGAHYRLEFRVADRKVRMVYCGNEYTPRGRIQKKLGGICLSTVSDQADWIVKKMKSVCRWEKLGQDMAIPLYTEIKIDHGGTSGYIYRADPCRRLQESGKFRGLHYWGTFSWRFDRNAGRQKEHKIPAKLLCIMRAVPGSSAVFGDDYEQDRLFATIHSLIKEPSTYLDFLDQKIDKGDFQHPASKLLLKGRLEVQGTQPKVSVVPLVHLIRPACVIPDFDPVFDQKQRIITMLPARDKAYDHIVLRSREQWSSLFQTLCVSAVSRKNEKGKHFGKAKRFSPRFDFNVTEALAAAEAEEAEQEAAMAASGDTEGANWDDGVEEVVEVAV